METSLQKAFGEQIQANLPVFQLSDWLRDLRTAISDAV